MIKLDFGEFAVNMQDAAALDMALLGDFANGFDLDETGSSAGELNYNVQGGGGNSARIRMYGAFDPTGATPGPTSTVDQLEIYSDADVDAGFPGPYRLIVTGLPGIAFATVFDDFLVAGDLGALYAGQPVEIEGSNGFGDTLAGGSLGDTVSGGGANDLLIGNGGHDFLYGGGGADTLTGGAGSDKMRGGSGNDLYIVTSSGDRVIDVGGGVDTVRSSITETLDSGVENLVLAGRNAIAGNGNASANLITGNAGANLLDGKGGADILRGQGGNDRLIWAATDFHDGGAGSDTLLVRGAGVTITLSALPDGKISNIEVINLTGSGNNVLNVNVQEVLDLSSTSDTLRVIGNAGDMVQTGDGWMPGTDQSIGAQVYRTFTQGPATLLVDADVTIGT